MFNNHLNITVSMPTLTGGRRDGSMQFIFNGTKKALPIPVDAEQAAYMVDLPDGDYAPWTQQVAVDADTATGMRFIDEQPPAREGYSQVVIVFFTHTIDHDQAQVAVFEPTGEFLDADNGDWVEEQDGRDKKARFRLEFGRNLLGVRAPTETETTETETA